MNLATSLGPALSASTNKAWHVAASCNGCGNSDSPVAVVFVLRLSVSIHFPDVSHAYYVTLMII